MRGEERKEEKEYLPRISFDLNHLYIWIEIFVIVSTNSFLKNQIANYISKYKRKHFCFDLIYLLLSGVLNKTILKDLFNVLWQ